MTAAMRGEFGGAACSSSDRRSASASSVRLRVQRQRQEFTDRCGQALVIPLVRSEQFGIADDLVKSRRALQSADFLEHALIVAGALDSVFYQLFAAIREPIHLHSRVYDREQQRRRNNREADQHQSAQ